MDEKNQNVNTSPERAELPADRGRQDRSVCGALSAKVIAGFFILGLLIVPVVIVPSLTVGTDMAMAWEWAGVLVLVELARRLSARLAPSEIFLLRYAAANLSEIAGGLVLGGGILGILAAARFGNQATWQAWFGSGIAGSGYSAWGLICGPVGLVVVMAIILSKVSQLSLGYLVYRMTAGGEHLPFPLAAMEARTAEAMSARTGRLMAANDSSAGNGQCLAIGVAAGFVFGLLQLAVPMISTALGRPIRPIIPPFIDLTAAWDGLFPAGAFGIAPNILLLAIGMILPWRACVGAFIASLVVQLAVNPFILRPAGMLGSWQAGGGAFAAQAACGMDFYISAGIGAAAGVGFVGLWCLLRARMKNRAVEKTSSEASGPSIFVKKAFDGPAVTAVIVYLIAAAAFIFLSDSLINGRADTGRQEHIGLFWLAMFALVFTPISAYCNARMMGIAGPGASPAGDSWVGLGGRKDIITWLAPLPAGGYGGMAHMLKLADLTGCKIRSILKAELILFPLSLAIGAIFWALLAWAVWGMEGLGRDWPGVMQLKAWSAVAAQHGPGAAAEAIKPDIIAGGFIGAIALIGAFALAGASSLYIYGAIAGINILPHVTIPIFAGACLARYLLPGLLGAQRFRQNAPVFAGGITAGFGLAALLAGAGYFIIAAAGG